jgi:hypothetical protein
LPKPITGSTTNFQDPFRAQVRTEVGCYHELHTPLDFLYPEDVARFGERVSSLALKLSAA